MRLGFNKYVIGLSLIFLLGLMNCNTDDEVPSNVNNVPDVEVEEIIPDGTEQYLNLESDYIFDQDKLPTFELNIPVSDLARINANPAAEEYVEGSLTFDGETLSPVGIRYKGSIGGFVNCVGGSNLWNPSGPKICPKLSMKIKINWNGSDNRFYGLKKLQLHSMNLDPSQMRDRVGYWLFAEMGVPTPRAIHARLLINGKYSGIYALIEQIDGRFARYHFDNGKGNVYKEVWPLNENGNAQNDNTFLQGLKTNEDENPSVEIMSDFAEAIEAASEDELQSVIKQWMNIDEIISYAVVDRTIRHDDGPFHWYCGGGCSNHNYYWYEDPVEGQLHLIPWDLDNAFENIITNQNPVTPIPDAWGEIQANCNPFRYGLFQLEQRSAACDKLIRGWASFASEYEELLSQFKSGPLAVEAVNTKIDKWAEQIRAATIEAHETDRDAISLAQWETALAELKSQLAFARNN